MSGYVIVICIMLIMFVFLAIVLTQDDRSEDGADTPADPDELLMAEESEFVAGETDLEPGAPSVSEEIEEEELSAMNELFRQSPTIDAETQQEIKLDPNSEETLVENSEVSQTEFIDRIENSDRTASSTMRESEDVVEIEETKKTD